MVTYGEPAHPQILFFGFSETDPNYLAMRRLGANSALVTDDVSADHLPLDEWDVAVYNGGSVEVPGHMHVLAFGCEALGMTNTRNDTGSSRVTIDGRHPSKRLTQPDGLDDTVRRLVARQLVPWVQSQEQTPYLTWYSSRSSYSAAWPQLSPLPISKLAQVFLANADGNAVAGVLRRSGGGHCWALPCLTSTPEIWLGAAMADWHKLSPDRVPAPLDWRSSDLWATSELREIRTALEQLLQQRDAQMATLDAREGQLRADELAANHSADAGLRRLLTAQGSDLVAAVASSLRTLGFSVEDMDEGVDPLAGIKLEDLRVAAPEDPTWTNITEVRGYMGGAKTSDLQRIERFARVYAERNAGASAASRWYIVNHSLSVDPSLRGAPLAGSQEDVELFAHDGGLVIDTRSLFVMARDAQAGVPAGPMRQALMQARGVWPLESQ